MEAPVTELITLCPHTNVAAVDSNVHTPATNAFRLRPSTTLSNDKDHQAQLKEKGLDYFKVYAAPASGPKGFTTMGWETDFKSLPKGSGSDEPQPKLFIGASTAALRFCALIASTITGLDHTKDVMEHFTMHMNFKKGDTSAALGPLMTALYHKAAPPALVPQILTHPTMHLAIMVTTMKKPWVKAPDLLLRLAFSGYLCAYAVWPRPPVTSLIFRRLCFYTGPSPPAFMSSQSEVTCLRLTEENFYEVLQATTAIPFVCRRVRHLPGVGDGLFFDGAVSDYMLNAVLTDPECPALLLSHGPVVHQTMVDVLIPWRCAPPEFHGNVSVLSPSPTFVSQLPGNVIPDTWDYFNPEFIAAPEKRQALWRTTYDLSLKLWPASFGQLMHAWQAQHKRKQEARLATKGTGSFQGCGLLRSIFRSKPLRPTLKDKHHVVVSVFTDLSLENNRSLQKTV